MEPRSVCLKSQCFLNTAAVHIAVSRSNKNYLSRGSSSSFPISPFKILSCIIPQLPIFDLLKQSHVLKLPLLCPPSHQNLPVLGSIPSGSQYAL